MAAANQIFKRYEEKYLLEPEQYLQFRQKTNALLNVDQYGESPICSIYYDTPDYRLIRRSIEKPVYKEKLRVRSYGVPQADSKVFVELKKKYDGIVYKRRLTTPYRAFYQASNQYAPLTENSQIAQEINWVFQQNPGLQPSLYISYQRIALYGVEDQEIRVTFDRDILWRDKVLDLQQGIWGNPLLKPEQRIMEIKVPGAIPLWLVKLLNELKIYPTSYSKCGNAYKQLLQQVSMKGAKISA